MTLRRLQALVYLLGLLGLALAVRSMASDLDGAVIPAWTRLVLPLAGITLAGVFSARAWSVLLAPLVHGATARCALYVSQLAKYIPGGSVAQAAGQVVLSADSPEARGRVAVAYPVFVVGSVIAGLLLAFPLAFMASVPIWLRVGVALGPLAVAALHPRVLGSLLGLVGRLGSRVPTAVSLPPTPRVIASVILAGANLASYGAAFALLVRSFDESFSFPVVALAFVAAWVVGFLVVPLPAGVGVREAVLLAVLPSLSTGAILAASLLHRLLALVAEVMLAGGCSLGRRLTSGTRRA